VSPQRHFDKSRANEALLAIRLTHFRAVSSFFESAMEKAKDERLAAAQKGISKAEALISTAFENIDFSTNVPNLFRRALFVAAYSMLETHLNLLATDNQQQKTLVLSLEEIRGQGIERARLYLKKVVGMSFPDTSPEWQVLKRLGELRNVLVHRYGRLEGEGRDKELVMWLTASPHVDIIPWGGVVWLAPTFTEFTLSHIEWLFRNLGYRFFDDE
jgi:hypothetical protein